MDVDCLGIFRPLLCPTSRMSTVCGNDGSSPDNLSLRPLLFHRRFSKCTTPLQFTPPYIGGITFLHTSPIHVPYISYFSPLLAKYFIYIF
ncbi:hypothetical protein ARMGADRAFT_175587 [Armillaria gallica]|uniref:Uncharacterized protein n=1 Tax=Armillaria gallica TaxID=47427 RepID=A0A2H3CBE9_ARMGA|nr:hypothetical protein ARMGADRAFT_175587 [Armillaria gallica]